MSSRAAGVKRLRAELIALGVSPQAATQAAELAVTDALRASAIARRYSKAWLTAAQQQGAEEASRATNWRARTIATTESSEAYNSGRLYALQSYPNIEVMRVWDSVLDRNVCKVCELADGTIVGIRESFPNGEPGSVHPNCRCTWQLVPLEYGQSDAAR